MKYGLAALFLLGIGVSAVHAQSVPPTIPASVDEIPRGSEDDKGIFNFIFENDMFAGTDRGYTNGARVSWLSSEKETPQWVKDIAPSLPLDDQGHKRISIALGQNIYTPDSTTRVEPDPNDRPYAGWLYGTFGITSDTGYTLDNVMLTLGVVGPDSYAGPVQNSSHRLLQDKRAEGWHAQLDNEPGVIVTYERKWRGIYETDANGLGVDVIPQVGLNLGNVDTSAAVATTFRLGYDLPADYGPPRIRPGLAGSDFFLPTENLSAYLFATVGGSAIARNIFLDGNTFEDGPSVDKDPLVGNLQLGAALTCGETRLSYTQVFMTREFKTQSRPDQFGVLTLSYRF